MGDSLGDDWVDFETLGLGLKFGRLSSSDEPLGEPVRVRLWGFVGEGDNLPDFSPYHQVPQVPYQHPVQIEPFSMVHRI